MFTKKDTHVQTCYFHMLLHFDKCGLQNALDNTGINSSFFLVIIFQDICILGPQSDVIGVTIATLDKNCWKLGDLSFMNQKHNLKNINVTSSNQSLIICQ